MVEASENAKKLFAEKFFAVVGTKRADDTVQMNPIWHEYKDGYFWLNSWRTSDWMRHLLDDGEVTLFIMDPQDAALGANQGTLVEASDEHGAEHIEELSMRYTGKPYNYGYNKAPRVRLKIEPTRITGYAAR